MPVFAMLPFVTGAIGYMVSGETLTDSLYESYALYFVSPVCGAYNIWIEIARWTAALVTTATILYALRRLGLRLYWMIKCLSKDSVAVYCASDTKISFERGHTGVIYPGRNFRSMAKSQIIMFDSDEENLRFYEENKKQLTGRRVYIGLKEIEYGLMKELGSESKVCFYDINGAIARKLWRKLALWEGQAFGNRIVITILGTRHLGRSILHHGLLLNIASLAQEIDYNFIGEHSLYQAAHGALPTCNQDSVRYLEADGENYWEVIRQSDIVIISEAVSIERLQTIGIVCSGQIFYYSPKEGDVGACLKLSRLRPFGRDFEIYTDENIRGNKLIEAAMEQNHRYMQSYGKDMAADKEAEWNKLDGFLKWSNISSSDFRPVLRSLAASGMELEELAELEHIRWCRFHYLNYWSFGVPENGESRDDAKKIHKCLCDFSELSEEDKEKDREIVREALSGGDGAAVLITEP